MTNGEKIKAMFPSMEVGFITESQIGIYVVKNQHSADVFDLDWWNAEYKEPTIKNDLAVDCVSRKQVLHWLENATDDNIENALNNNLDFIPSVTLQESIHRRCNQCKYYGGVHNVQGHAPCSYHKIGGVMWNWYCSQFESEDKE